MADIALRFGLYLDVVIEKNRRRSWLRWGFYDWTTFKDDPKI